jgi:hypothetical protein
MSYIYTVPTSITTMFDVIKHFDSEAMKLLYFFPLFCIGSRLQPLFAK